MHHLSPFIKALTAFLFCFLNACIAESGIKSNSKAQSFPESTALSLTSPKVSAHLEARSTKLHRSLNKKTAKNLIIFIGDGMGISTITAARIFDGQSQGLKGEEHSLAFEDFENLALVKTYNTNAQVPDSAGTATAILSGYKTNIGTINVRPNPDMAKMIQEGCVDKSAPPNLTIKAKAAGLSVGVISTARITHATPAALYGHSPNRDWEADKDIKGKAAKAGCESIAAQLIKSDVDVALGGGAKEFTSSQIKAWQARSTPAKTPYQYITDATALKNANPAVPLLGLFDQSHMDYEADRIAGEQPSLAEMTQFAIQALSQNSEGYILMIEAGRVDHAHHDTNAYRALRDMQALNAAVKLAKAEVGNDTLIIVTADHSHAFTIAGYPVRGNPILGLVRGFDIKTGQPANEYTLDSYDKPYTTLGYYNGPNKRKKKSPALSDNTVQAKDYRQQSAVRLPSETHAGEDVPLYASGPGSDQIRGVMEQDEIGKIIDVVLGLTSQKE